MNRNRGFTLVEVLLAISIASILLLTVYGVFSGSSEAKQLVEQRSEAAHLGRVIFARIGRELLGLSLNAKTEIPVLVGGRNDRNEPFLEMATNVSEGREQGLQSISYRLAIAEQDDKILWRGSTPALLHADPWPEQRLTREITEMTLRFYDGSNWREEWDSRQDGRPRLVELTLQVRSGEETLPLHTVFQPPRSEVR
jgi:general secretion pathway protein J